MQYFSGIIYVSGISSDANHYFHRVSKKGSVKNIYTLTTENIRLLYINENSALKQFSFEFKNDISLIIIGDIVDNNFYSNIKNIHQLVSLNNITYEYVIEEIYNKIELLDGIFSILIIDRKYNKLTIFTEKNGLMPVYYYKSEKYLLFSTELKTILSFNDQPYSLNSNNIYELFKYGFISPPDTLFDNIKMVLPGNILSIEDGKITIKNRVAAKYQEYSKNIDLSSEEYFILFEKSTINKVQNFKNIALLLSGGIDSAAIASILQKHNIDFKCLTLDFNPKKPSEIDGAKEICALFKKEHIFVNKLTKEMVSSFPNVVSMNEAPFSNGVTDYELTKMISDDVDVVLTGDGNDLVWGAFQNISNNQSINNNIQNIQTCLRFRSRINDDILNYIFHIIPCSDLLINKLSPAYQFSGNSFRDFNQFDTKIFGDSFVFNLIGKLRINPKKQIFRFPYMDPALDNFVKSLPNQYKQQIVDNNMITKYLFKHALLKQNILPATIINRKKTWLYSPNAEWLRSGLKQYFENIVFNKNSYIQIYFNTQNIRNIWNAHLNRKTDESYLLIMLMTFELWLKILIEDFSIKLEN